MSVRVTIPTICLDFGVDHRHLAPAGVGHQGLKLFDRVPWRDTDLPGVHQAGGRQIQRMR